MLEGRSINLAFYIAGAFFTALGLIEIPALAPYGKAFTSFAIALATVARWDQLKGKKGKSDKSDKTPSGEPPVPPAVVTP